MITRRRFIETSTLATAAVLAPSAFAHNMPQAARPAVPNLDPNTLAKFVDPLPIPAIAQPVEHRPAPGNPSQIIPLYRISMKEITAKLHRDLPPTRLWSYGGSVPGPTIETRTGKSLLVEWENELPGKHFLPIDHSMHGAEKGSPEGRGVVHLHGGKTPPESDGYPEDWYVSEESRTYHYPNQQEPTLLWYHDHSMGINRLNIYAGMMGLFLIRDEVEDALHLPGGKYEIPLVIFDRDITTAGQLNYPVSADPEHPWVPEAFGESHLVNGKLFPYLEVEPRKYRFRVLNGANGRFYRLSLSDAAEFYQIGSDQGLLSTPVNLKRVQLAPGERADIVIDFAQYKGTQLELKSDSFSLMQFRVSAAQITDSSQLPTSLRPSHASPNPHLY